MKKVNKLVKFGVVICLAAITMSACGKKVEPLTESGTASQAPAASVAPVSSTDPIAKSWKTAPEMSIDVSKAYSAVVKTNKGSFTIELFAKDAPKTVNNFVFLAKNDFYNGVIFHRIVETFMIQTGDPTGTGTGGPGYSFEDELSPTRKYTEGVVAMANSGPNTDGSQFFVNTGDNTAMPNLYSIFGQVTEGMDTVKKIAATPVVAGPTGEVSSPTEKVTIDSVEIVEK